MRLVCDIHGILFFQMLTDQKIQWSSRHFYGSSWKQRDITLNISVHNKMESQCSRYNTEFFVVVLLIKITLYCLENVRVDRRSLKNGLY